MAKTLPPLKRSEVDSAAQIIQALKIHGRDLEQVIRDTARRKGVTVERLAAEIIAGNESLRKDLDRIIADGVERAAGIGHQEAAKAIEGEAVRRQVLKYDPKRTAKYLALIAPENGRGLAAVFTDKMSERAIKDLRRITVETFRQADLNGWTANDRNKELQKAWDVAAGDLNAFRFVDNSGKEWENARYLQMLVRTTQARVHREAYADTLVENGDDLAVVTPAGDNCPTCQAWAGIIVSVSGTNEKYPAYESAVDAGLFHPNCDCTLERVDETLDAENIATQADAKTPDDLEDLDAMRAYRDEIGLATAKPDDGKTDFSELAMERYKERLAKRAK